MNVELVRQLVTFGTLLTAVGLVAFASQRGRRGAAIGLGLALQGGLLLVAAGATRLAASGEWLLLVVVATGVLSALGASAGVGVLEPECEEGDAWERGSNGPLVESRVEVIVLTDGREGEDD